MDTGFIPDIPRLHTAIAEWSACMIYVLLLAKRYKGVKLWASIALSLLGFCALQMLAGVLPLFLWIPGMIVAMVAMWACILWLCKIKLFEAIFWTARAFVIAEFTASLEWQLYNYFSQSVRFGGEWVFQWLFLAVVCGGVFVAILLFERRYLSGSQRLGFSSRDVYSSVGTALASFVMSNMSFISTNTPFSGRYANEIFYIRTLVNLCGLILLFAQQEQRHWLQSKLELEAMRNILTRQYEQYCISKDNIEDLNRRFHDLKRYIQIIRAEENPEKKAQYLDQMETGIKIFEAQTQTGSNVLDTILTGKSRFCVENNINFTCVADGSYLNFMDVADICSIVGNALDNAIECVAEIADTEKRLVNVAIYTQNDLLIMRFENFFESQPSFQNGMPISTKQNKSEHGYGLKSIKFSAEKYSGSFSISTKNNWFSLCVLIPIPNNQ